MRLNDAAITVAGLLGIAALLCIGLGVPFSLLWRHAPAPSASGRPEPIFSAQRSSMPLACVVKHVYIDAGNVSRCASDKNTCQSGTCGGAGVGPCKTLKEWNRRCDEWFEEGTCVTFMGVAFNGEGTHSVEVCGPHATDGASQSPTIGTSI